MKNFEFWLKENTLWFEDKPFIVPSNANTNNVNQTNVNTTILQPTKVKNKEASNIEVNSVLGHIVKIVRSKIDATTWDYGKDTVETAFESIAYLLPLNKNVCDSLRNYWISFKNALYGMSENWWGGNQRSGPPNPVLHDTAIMRVKDLNNIFDEINQLFQKYEDDNVKKLFLIFYKNYSKIIPQLVGNINHLRPK